jgi:hypothetical protein
MQQGSPSKPVMAKVICTYNRTDSIDTAIRIDTRPYFQYTPDHHSVLLESTIAGTHPVNSRDTPPDLRVIHRFSLGKSLSLL